MQERAKAEDIASARAGKYNHADWLKDKDELYNPEKAKIHYPVGDFHMKTCLLIALWSDFFTKWIIFIGNLIVSFWHHKKWRPSQGSRLLPTMRSLKVKSTYTARISRQSRDGGWETQNNSRNHISRIFFSFEL